MSLLLHLMAHEVNAPLAADLATVIGIGLEAYAGAYSVLESPHGSNG